MVKVKVRVARQGTTCEELQVRLCDGETSLNAGSYACPWCASHSHNC